MLYRVSFRIDDVMFYHLDSKEQFEQQLAEVNKYLKLSSYGYMGVDI